LTNYQGFPEKVLVKIIPIGYNEDESRGS